ncbi:MAG: ATP-binding protein [Elusimicrobia bacterium]|nr:ATP-binding protein [Elusimicrobiota bacterium]
MKLLNKLLLIVLGAGLIPIIPTGIFLYYYQSAAKKNILTLHENVSQMAALLITQKTGELAGRLENMWGPDASYVTRENLQKSLRHNPEFIFLAFTGADGREILSGGAPELKRLFGYVDLGNEPLFKKAAATGVYQAGRFELLFNMPVCRLVYPLGGGYYAFALVNMRDLFEKLEAQRLGASGGVLVADGDGNFVSVWRRFDDLSRERLKGVLESKKEKTFFLDGTRARYIGAIEKAHGFDLYAVTLQDRAEAFSGISRITWLMAFFLLAIITAFYFSALAFSRRLAGPVEALAAGAARVARQDFKTPVDKFSGISELDALLQAFNSMMRESDRYHGLQLEKIFDEKSKLELLISLIHDAIILCDLKGDLLYANASANTLLGVEGENGLKGEALRWKIAGLVQAKSSSRDGFVELDSSGAKKYYRISLQTLSTKTQKPAVFMILRDVTLEREIQRVKEDFFHAVAHDLRAPLLTMQGYIKLLEREFAPDAKQAGYVKSVRDSSDRLFKLLENILDISRMEAGQLKPDLRKINAADFLVSAAEGFKALFEEKNISFEIDVSGAKNTEFSADSSLMRRVIENLLSNAWKFTPAGGKVSALVTAEGRSLRFEVADDGPGIPDAQLENIFEKYKQLKPGDGESGFGLGLAIARKIVELHGGTIRAESKISGGVVFKVSLPVRNADNGSAG